MVGALAPEGLVRREGPWWVDLVARRKGERLLLHLLNRGSANPLDPTRRLVEAVAEAGPITLSVPLAERPSRVYLAPDPAELEWRWKDGLLTARVSGLAIHNTLVIE